MAEKIIMPQGGQDLKTGQIIQWLFSEGDQVKKGDVVCEVETEKAVFEVKSPIDGYLIKIIRTDGQEAEILTPIGFIGEKNEQVADFEPRKSKAQNKSKNSNVSRTVDKTAGKIASEKILISPKARKLARDNNISLDTLHSKRPDGKVTIEDVQTAIQDRQDTQLEIGSLDQGTQINRSTNQKVAGAHLTRSWQQTPHIFVTITADMTAAIQFREEHKAIHPNSNLSYTHLIVRACAEALEKFPAVNSSLIDEDTLVQWNAIHVGIAVSVGNDLLVPVVEDLGKLDLAETAEITDTVVENARQGNRKQMAPAHFTISNLGMFDVDQFTAIINPPESAILAVGSIQKKVVVDESDQLVMRSLMKMTLSLDHRVGDGVLAAKFLNHIKFLLEHPDKL